MIRILIAIAAVFCAQVAFQTYLAVERTDIEYSSLTTPLEPAVTNDNMTPADLTVREPEQIEIPTIVRTRYIVRQPRAQLSYETVRRPARKNIEPAMAAFKPVIITVPARPASANYGTEMAPQKRSFPSKAVAVIKKPYGWLRAVASKFN